MVAVLILVLFFGLVSAVEVSSSCSFVSIEKSENVDIVETVSALCTVVIDEIEESSFVRFNGGNVASVALGGSSQSTQATFRNTAVEFSNTQFSTAAGSMFVVQYCSMDNVQIALVDCTAAVQQAQPFLVRSVTGVGVNIYINSTTISGLAQQVSSAVKISGSFTNSKIVFSQTEVSWASAFPALSAIEVDDLTLQSSTFLLLELKVSVTAKGLITACVAYLSFVNTNFKQSIVSIADSQFSSTSAALLAIGVTVLQSQWQTSKLSIVRSTFHNDPGTYDKNSLPPIPQLQQAAQLGLDPFNILFHVNSATTYPRALALFAFSTDLPGVFQFESMIHLKTTFGNHDYDMSNDFKQFQGSVVLDRVEVVVDSCSVVAASIETLVGLVDGITLGPGTSFTIGSTVTGSAAMKATGLMLSRLSLSGGTVAVKGMNFNVAIDRNIIESYKPFVGVFPGSNGIGDLANQSISAIHLKDCQTGTETEPIEISDTQFEANANRTYVVQISSGQAETQEYANIQLRGLRATLQSPFRSWVASSSKDKIRCLRIDDSTISVSAPNVLGVQYVDSLICHYSTVHLSGSSEAIFIKNGGFSPLSIAHSNIVTSATTNYVAKTPVGATSSSVVATVVDSTIQSQAMLLLEEGTFSQLRATVTNVGGSVEILISFRGTTVAESSSFTVSNNSLAITSAHAVFEAIGATVRNTEFVIEGNVFTAPGSLQLISSVGTTSGSELKVGCNVVNGHLLLRESDVLPVKLTVPRCGSNTLPITKSTSLAPTLSHLPTKTSSWSESNVSTPTSFLTMSKTKGLTLSSVKTQTRTMSETLQLSSTMSLFESETCSLQPTTTGTCMQPSKLVTSARHLTVYDAFTDGFFNLTIYSSQPLQKHSILSHVQCTWGLVTAVQVVHNEMEATISIQTPIIVDLFEAYDVGCALLPGAFRCQADSARTVNTTLSPVKTPTPELFRGTIIFFSVVASIFGGANVAMTQARAAMMLQLSVCKFSHSAPLPSSVNPTGMHFGPAVGAYYRGAVVGNVLLLLGVSLICFLVVVTYWQYRMDVWRKRQRRKAGTDTDTDAPSLGSSAAALFFPGILILPFSILLQPIVSASLSTARFGQGDADGVISSAGFLVAFVGMCMASSAVLFFFTSIPEKPAPLSASRRLLGPFQWLLTISYKEVAWKDADGRIGRTHALKMIFNRFREGWEWFIVYEMIFCCACGFIDGAKTSTGCGTAGGFCVAIALCFFVPAWFFRPMTSAGSRFYMFGSSIFFLASSIALLVQTEDGAVATDLCAALITIASVVEMCRSGLFQLLKLLVRKERDAIAARIASTAPPPSQPTNSMEEGLLTVAEQQPEASEMLPVATLTEGSSTTPRRKKKKVESEEELTARQQKKEELRKARESRRQAIRNSEERILEEILAKEKAEMERAEREYEANIYRLRALRVGEIERAEALREKMEAGSSVLYFTQQLQQMQRSSSPRIVNMSEI